MTHRDMILIVFLFIFKNHIQKALVSGHIHFLEKNMKMDSNSFLKVQQ
jgi:hypothetical protein